MIKTIKIKKQLRMDELIKHVWDNELFPRDYKVDGDITEARYLTFNLTGMFRGNYGYHERDTFTVEVEEEITKDLIISELVSLTTYGTLHAYSDKSIADVLKDDGADCYTIKIYALTGNELELIWDKERESE